MARSLSVLLLVSPCTGAGGYQPLNLSWVSSSCYLPSNWLLDCCSSSNSKVEVTATIEMYSPNRGSKQPSEELNLQLRACQAVCSPHGQTACKDDASPIRQLGHLSSGFDRILSDHALTKPEPIHVSMWCSELCGTCTRTGVAGMGGPWYLLLKAEGGRLGCPA